MEIRSTQHKKRNSGGRDSCMTNDYAISSMVTFDS